MTSSSFAGFPFLSCLASQSGRRRLAQVALVALLVPWLQATPPFPHERSDLPADPGARFGALSNGLRYVIQPNREPRGRASLRLLVLAGSFHESDQERGLAHYLEHLAFNGSQHFAPGTLVEFFQRMGMRFGGDTNASTGFERTLYLLELPDTKAETLAEGLRVFSDYAGGLLLRPESVEKERGIILSERRVRDTVESRAYQAMRTATMTDTLVARRLPIGVAEVIQAATREQLLAYWNAWYRPERMVVIAVGDFAPEAIEKEIATWMAPLTARAPARPEPEFGAIPTFTGIRPVFLPDPEAPATTVTILSHTPRAREPDSFAARRQSYVRNLAFNMLSARLGGIARGANAAVSRATAYASVSLSAVCEAQLQLTCKPENWRLAVNIGEMELRRALEFGFTASELKSATAILANSLTQFSAGAATRPSRTIADGIASSLVSDRVWMSPEDVVQRFKPEVEQITREECLTALRAAFDANGRYLVVGGNAPPLADPAAAILAQHAVAAKIPVKPRTETTTANWAYALSNPPGEILKREHVADLDFTMVTFANGVRLNVKRTDFEARRVRFTARVGHGAVSEPASQRGLASLASNVFINAGLKKHSYSEWRRIFTGREINLTFSAPLTDAFVFNGFTVPADFVPHLETIVAYLTDAGYRPEALPPAHRNLEQLYTRYEHTATGPFSTSIARRLAGGDTRFGLPPKPVLMQRTLAELRAWLEPQLARGPLEFSVIGDIEVDTVIDAVARTLGTLPARESRNDQTELRQATFPTQPFKSTYPIYSDIPKGTVALYWPTSTQGDVKANRRATLLGSVLHDALRTKVREELGATYSPSARYTSYRDFPQLSYLSATVDVEPGLAPKITDVVAAVADQLAREGVSADQLERARQPALASARDSLRNNLYWLGNVLDRAQQHPESLPRARTLLSDLEGITLAEMNQVAREYLARARMSAVAVLPRAVAEQPRSVASSTTTSLKATVVDAADFAGPEGSFRDPLHPLSGQLPANWRLREIKRWGTNLTTIVFADADHPRMMSNLLHTRHNARIVFGEQGAEAWLRRDAQVKADQRVDRERLANFRNRADTYVFTENDGHSTLTGLVEYTRDGQTRTEFIGKVVYQAATVTLQVAASAAEIETMRPALERFVASLRLAKPEPSEEASPVAAPPASETSGPSEKK